MNEFLEAFLARREKDVSDALAEGNGRIPDFLLNWHYQDQRGDQKYGAGMPQDFHDFHGPSQIREWFGWMSSAPRPEYFPSQFMTPLVDMSKAQDRRILEKAGVDYDFSSYEGVGRNNAQDYLYQNMYPVPDRNAISRILDFGAGLGRQSNLWSQQQSRDLIMVGMDAIELSYCLQNFYYSANDLPLYEYITTGELDIDADKPGLYHCPTWRWDLLPGNFFDLVICCQVLPELSPELAKFAIHLFLHALKPGGALYIRDHDTSFNPALTWNRIWWSLASFWNSDRMSLIVSIFTAYQEFGASRTRMCSPPWRNR